MTKCKRIECVYTSELEEKINSFVADKEVISVSVISDNHRVYAFIVYKEQEDDRNERTC